MTRIALAQMRCEKAAIAQNLHQIADLLAEAATRGVDILALPELEFLRLSRILDKPPLMLLFELDWA